MEQTQTSIDELLAEREELLRELSEAYKIVHECRSKLTSVDAEINRIKMPNAGKSRVNRVKNLDFLNQKTTPTVAVAAKPQAKKKDPYYAPSISEHALVRYMERIMAIDIEGLRNSILTKEIRAALSMGATRININGIEMVAREGKIITVID